MSSPSLRRTAPVWWNAQPRGASGFDDDGYWVVTRHADVLEVSRSSDLYSSQEKTAIIRHAQAVTPESLDMQRLILLNIDPPQHTKLRGIVSRGFTPRAIGRLREALTARAERIVRAAAGGGHRRLRHRRGRRASAAGDRRAARDTAGRPAQDLRLVERDDRL